MSAAFRSDVDIGSVQCDNPMCISQGLARHPVSRRSGTLSPAPGVQRVQRRGISSRHFEANLHVETARRS